MPDTSLPPLPCYLNGQFLPLHQAQVSVMDRGFIFGDGIYEVLPVYAGTAFRLEQHLDRMERSLAATRIANPYGRAQWRDLIAQLIAAYADARAEPVAACMMLVYIQITRGVALRDHAMPAALTPTVFAMANAMSLPSAAQVAEGVACVTADDFRWQKAHIKSISLLGSVFARQLSVDAGAVETVMFRDGFLSEAAASNVWIVKNGVVIGTPKDNLVLEGIRYGLIEELCRAQGIGFELRRISRDEVFAADEVLLSSATKEVLAVTTLDGKPIANGRPGPVCQALAAGYQVAIAQSKAAARSA